MASLRQEEKERCSISSFPQFTEEEELSSAAGGEKGERPFFQRE